MRQSFVTVTNAVERVAIAEAAAVVHRVDLEGSREVVADTQGQASFTVLSHLRIVRVRSRYTVYDALPTCAVLQYHKSNPLLHPTHHEAYLCGR